MRKFYPAFLALFAALCVAVFLGLREVHATERTMSSTLTLQTDGSFSGVLGGEDAVIVTKLGPPPPVPFSNTKALTLGTNKYLSGTTTDHVVNKVTAVSFSFWIKLTTVDTGQSILGKGDGYNAIGYRINLNAADDSFTFWIAGDSYTKYAFYRCTQAVTTGSWFHVVVTKAANSTQTAGIKFYINGVDSAFTPFSQDMTTIDDPAAPFDVGKNLTWGWGSYTIDEISIWDKALSQSEVTEVYNSGTPTDLSEHSAIANLTSWYRFESDDTTATIHDHAGAIDLTGNGLASGDFVAY